MGILHRTIVPFIAGLLVVLMTAPPVHARRAIALKFPRLEVPPHSDREACIFVRLPRDTPMDIGGTLIVNKGLKQDFVSHHFLMWAYLGDHAADFPENSQLQDGEACLDFGPSDRDRRILIAGSQSIRQRLPIPAGLAQRLTPVDENGRKVVGLILNSHWINSSDRTQNGSVKIKVLPNKGKPKRFIEPIFDVIANATIGVPPADLDASPPAGLAPGEVGSPGTELEFAL